MGLLSKFLTWISGGKTAREATRIMRCQKTLNDRIDNAYERSGIMMKVENKV